MRPAAPSQFSGDPTSPAPTPASSTNPVLQPEHEDVFNGSSVTVVGRYTLPEPSNPNHIRLGFVGNAVGVRFIGSSISAIMQDTNNDGYVAANRHNYFNVTVDGNIINNFQIQRDMNTYLVADNLSPGPHTVWLTKRTESPVAGETDFWSFELGADGTFLRQPPHLPRRLLAMGASNETGWGADASVVPPADCSGDTGSQLVYQNFDDTWMQVAANNLNAEVHDISYIGCGLQSGIDDNWGCKSLPWLFELASPLNANAPWDPNAWVPDVAILNFGPLDYEASAIGPQFEPVYVAFLEHLLDLYPKLHIYLLMASHYTGAERATVLAHDQNVIAKVAAQGYKQTINTLVLPPYTGTTQGCSGHTDKPLHYAEGMAIAARLKEDLSW